MQSAPKFIKGGSFDETITKRGDYYYINGTDLRYDKDVECKINCRTECLPKVVRVKFNDPETACDPCNRSAGIVLHLDRGQLERVETGLELYTNLEFSYPFADGVTATAANIAAWVNAQVNTPQPNGHDHFGIQCGPDPLSQTDTLLFVMTDCNYSFSVRNMPSSTQNIITTVFEGEPGVLTQQQLNDMFPLQQGITTIPGAPVPVMYFPPCEKYCTVEISYCQDACRMNKLNVNQNQKVVDPFIVVVFIVPESQIGSWLNDCSRKCKYQFTTYAELAFDLTDDYVIINAAGTETFATYSPLPTDTIDSICQKLSELSGLTVFSDGQYITILSDTPDDGYTIQNGNGSEKTELVGILGSGGLCGCLLDISSVTFPFTGFIQVRPGVLVEVSAATGTNDIVAALDDAGFTGRRTALGHSIYFPPSIDIDCGSLRIPTVY